MRIKLCMSLLFAGLVLFMLPNNQVNALSCARVDDHQERLKTFGGAVYGEILQSKEDVKQRGILGPKEYARYILVEVKRSWGIELPSQIMVSTDFTWGFPFEKGKAYLIYVQASDGELVSSPCSPVKEIQSLDQLDKAFGEGQAPVKQIHIENKMWFKTVTDYDLLIIAGGTIALLLIVFLSIKKRKENEC
ncbi:hypothetical protein RAC89_29335 [Paenibacillus sp. GD4]|uniref:hypothetical protein n=1 Tax=Paenibacillus sp. GD4 TaxID=3068890 RepID=UPI002796DF1F|nr:hypothetical protein [Paenibacillus sp. GD4]MDQ1914486.1 hypothetical protein [Paenibacillus sp. GD4]